MGLWVPSGSRDFTWKVSNVDSARPAATPGTLLTAGSSGAKGSWSQVLSSANVSKDVWGLYVQINNVASNGVAETATVDIGVDPAGGTSYTVLIADLLSSCAGQWTNAIGAIQFYFPIRIKSGSTVAARFASATDGNTCEVVLRAVGAPREPSRVWAGTKVTTYGITGRSGVAITSGTASEGAWTSIATTTAEHNFWQLAMGIDDSTMTNAAMYFCDLAYGDASNKHVIIQDQHYAVTTFNEALTTRGLVAGCGRLVKSGATLYGRIQCSTTPDSNLSLSAYGVT